MAVMVVPCLPAGERAELLADCDWRYVVEEEQRGAAGLQRLLAQPTGKVLIAVRLMVLPGAFTHMPN